MRVEIENLLNLQNFDQRLHQLESELDQIPREEAALEQRLKASQEKLEAIRAETRTTEVNRKKLDLEVQNRQALIAKYKAQQSQTRKNEEFSALNHEIERAQGEITALEDQELDLMAAYEEGQRKVAQEQEGLQRFEKEIKEKKEALKKRKSLLEEEIAKNRLQQSEAEQKIGEDLLRRYRRILASKKDVAVVSIEHGSCMGCHMKLTSQTVLSAKGGENIVACENCGRIVYSAD